MNKKEKFKDTGSGSITVPPRKSDRKWCGWKLNRHCCTKRQEGVADSEITTIHAPYFDEN